jgi:Spy/CpxP family protein refolding chaperone
MKLKWLTLSVAGVLCLAPLAWTARAQERPTPEPETIAEGPDEGFADLDGMDEMDDLDLLLAAVVAAEAGPGPGGAMGPGPGGMGPGGRRGPGGRMGPGGQGPDGLREKLNLTDDQKTKLADIRDRQARRAIPVQGDLRIAALDLRKVMQADKPDQRAIDAQIDKVAGLRASLQKSRVASMLEARSVLTPAQQKLMREHRGMRMRGRMGMGHGMGMDAGMGPGEKRVERRVVR